MRVCVFCGSNAGSDPTYGRAARDLGAQMASRGIGLVYGGARVGLMGAVADAVLAQGGEAIGVIPRALVDREVAHTGLSDLRVVDTMHERKALMAELSAGFIALPGGIGTLEELFEVATWSYLGLHAKPLVLCDVAGYFSALAAFLDHAVDTGFLRPQARALLPLASDVPAALEAVVGAQRPES